MKIAWSYSVDIVYFRLEQEHLMNAEVVVSTSGFSALPQFLVARKLTPNYSISHEALFVYVFILAFKSQITDLAKSMHAVITKHAVTDLVSVTIV